VKYASLHHHSTFSFLDGYALPEAHVKRAADLGMGTLALTEHGNVSSHVQLEQAAVAAGIKPIFGCELYTGPVEETTRGQIKNHLTILAEDLQGYRNLLRVVSRGWAEGFYYESTVSGHMLAQHSKGLIALSGCTGSLLATSIVGGKSIEPEDASYERGKAVAARFQDHFGDGYYLEVQAFPSLEAIRRLNPALEQIGSELGIPLVATGDVHYTRIEEGEMQRLLHTLRGMNKEHKQDTLRRYDGTTPLCPPTSDVEILRRLRATGLSRQASQQALMNTEEIAARCTVTLPKLEALQYPIAKGEAADSMELWRQWIHRGWRYRGIGKLDPLTRQSYRQRLLYEMGVIEGKEYIDYFLIVSDLVRHAKDKGIPVGPARGSAAASLVCYLLRITEVDPLQFPTLVFERFIDTTRQDLPDIDLDFDGERRHEVRDYLVTKYGAERVGNIGTFTKYKGKNSLDDVARVYQVPAPEVDTIKELLIERSSGDLRANATLEDTIEQFDRVRDVVERWPALRKAMDLEGNYKTLGVHAAGLVVANGPLNASVATYTREVPKGSGNWIDVVSVDKSDAEYLNLLKIDALSLDTMTLLSKALNHLDMKLEELYDINLDDQETLAGFRENDVVGIFQFEGRAQRSVCGELQPDTFAEIADICALSRPGPLHNGATAEYIDVKRGRKTPKRIHPLLDPITAYTHYQIVYQEQILRICMEIGDFDWTHAAYIRKIISRKIGEQEFSRQFAAFWEGANRKGIDYDTAHQIWNACITAGAYAFNNAHTVSYGMLAFWCMWLKRHHPQEFFAAALASMDEKKQLPLLRDALKHDLYIEPPEVGTSAKQWMPVGIQGKGLLAGLQQVPGIGASKAQDIIEWRNGKGTFDIGGWYDLLEIKGIGEKTVETIMEFCAKDDPFEIEKMTKQIAVAKQLIAKHPTLPTPTHSSAEVPYSRGQDVEVCWLGQIVDRNLRDLFELHFSRTGEDLDPKTVQSPALKEYVVMRGADDTDEDIVVTVNRFKYAKFREAVWSIKLAQDMVLVRGIKRGNQARRAIYVTDMWVISMDEEDE
jgi:DNA polymerase-3 subunit alpha